MRTALLVTGLLAGIIATGLGGCGSTTPPINVTDIEEIPCPRLVPDVSCNECVSPRLKEFNDLAGAYIECLKVNKNCSKAFDLVMKEIRECIDETTKE